MKSSCVRRSCGCGKCRNPSAPFKLFRVRRGELAVTLQVPDVVESTAGYAPSWAAVAWAGELITETPDEQQWRVTQLMEVDERTLEQLRADASR